MTVPNKQFFRVKPLAGLRGQKFNSWTVYKFKIKLLYNEEKLFYTKTELLNFKFTVPLAKLDIVSSRPVSSCLLLSDNILVDIQLVTFPLLSNIRELNIGSKKGKF